MTNTEAELPKHETCDLRSKILNDGINRVDWWLKWIAIYLMVIGLMIPLIGYFTITRTLNDFSREAQKSLDEISNYARQAEIYARQAEENAKKAGRDPQEIKDDATETIESAKN